MNLKTILYATGAAMGIFTTSAVTGATANAAVTPTPQSQQANKTNTNSQTANTNKNQQSNQSKSNTDQSAKKTDQSKTDQNKAATTTPAKTQTTPTKTGNQTNTPAKSNSSSNQQANNSTPAKTTTLAKTTNSTATATTLDQRAPRLTGSAYKSENAGFKPTVQNKHANKNVTVKYSINTYESDGSASSKPFQIKIYKDGSLYKTINASSGTATGSFSAPKGTYTLRVYTSQSTHYTGSLSVE